MLESAGVPFETEPANLDEDSVRTAPDSQDTPIEQVASTLARKKAEIVSARRPGRLVLGADQMLECDGHRFDKVASITEARQQLEALQGRTHHLVTSVVLMGGGGNPWNHTAVSRLTMRSLDPASLDRYLDDIGEAACASVGCYQIEGRGIGLFERIEGDYYAIIGLPLLAVLRELRARGMVWP